MILDLDQCALLCIAFAFGLSDVQILVRPAKLGALTACRTFTTLRGNASAA
jgi:hypothetical protein